MQRGREIERGVITTLVCSNSYVRKNAGYLSVKLTFKKYLCQLSIIKYSNKMIMSLFSCLQTVVQFLLLLGVSSFLCSSVYGNSMRVDI